MSEAAGSRFQSNTYDFQDSEGAGSKECFASGTQFNFTDLQFVSASGIFPNISTALKMFIHTDDSRNFINAPDTTFTNGTYCIRHYFRLSSDYDNQTGMNFKSMRIQDQTAGNNDPGYETAWHSDNSRLNLMPGGALTPFCTTGTYPCTIDGIGRDGSHPNDVWGTDISVTDCQNSSCILELCLDHNETGSLAKLRYRGRMRTLAGEQTDWNALSPLTNATVHAGSTARIFLTTLATNGSWVTFPSTYYAASHGMAAYFPGPPSTPCTIAEQTANGAGCRWIGAASEIEGGAGSAPPLGVSGSMKINGQVQVK